MQTLSLEERSAQLERMSEGRVDILVIGGGITGAGVALDAAARGYSVALVDKGDFAGGTSSKSTKLVHGGIRYLSQFDFALTRESLVERGLLLRNAPFLVKSIGFVLPLYAGAKHPMGTPISPPFGIGMRFVIRAGLLMYDMLAGKLGIHAHRRIGMPKVARLAPCLNLDKLQDAFVYYDGQTDDTRLTMAILRTAVQHGAGIANYTELLGFGFAGGEIREARLLDHLSGREFSVQAGTVVNAGGVFAGAIEELAGPSSIRIRPSKGVHLTVSRESLRMGNYAIVLPETDDGRLLFLVPWGPRVTIGTTDNLEGDINTASAGPEDVEYLLRHVNRYMSCRLSECDIISAWAGYRPLISSRRSAAQSSKLSRTHAVLDGPGGMVTIVGGKLTTYRRMAQDTVDHIARKENKGREAGKSASITARLPLAGSDDLYAAVSELKARARDYSLGGDVVGRLLLYGSEVRAILDILAADPTLKERIVHDLPYIMAEVVYACRYEMAANLDDVLARRQHINFEDWSRGLEAAPKVAALMSRELKWDAAEQERQVAAYRDSVRADSGWRWQHDIE